jgi:hypothetical protein
MSLFPMPLYRFVVKNSQWHDEPTGTELADDGAARAEALRIIRELTKSSDPAWKGWSIGVTEGSRRSRFSWQNKPSATKKFRIPEVRGPACAGERSAQLGLSASIGSAVTVLRSFHASSPRLEAGTILLPPQ